MNNSGGAVNHVQFNSFGKPINSTAPLAGFPFGLDGMPYNATTGLYQTETVAYDPSTGQRLSQDPIGFASGTTNLTAYDGNNPVENVDPSGMCYPGLGGAGSAVPPIYLSGPAAEPDTVDTAYDISNPESAAALGNLASPWLAAAPAAASMPLDLPESTPQSGPRTGGSGEDSQLVLCGWGAPEANLDAIAGYDASPPTEAEFLARYDPQLLAA